ncbi:hypothetical protein COY87_04210 [Candidatus Roizmanbacteria bacterium CG_4_10_14_0_8_um_filter_33_9]|uniref:Uncharacterized protein n=1 Tax=Candidatus Roizmanbacteria bacterium CG_4_10_14_0_8_um_filter_33_9 TaxID=1974826 RepID=A0A2M7QIP2_9BACT|nr:MAG: hypothetical protein COY87_04210 [Candidatus Roizmanbacteria bacterium CG_4_10_14_0_8_um_filter_33_9]
MKKLIVYFLLFVFIHVFFVSNTFAIFDKRTQFPGISCGVAGAKKTTASADDATKCCTYSVSRIEPLNKKMESWPLIGRIVKPYNDKLNDLQQIQKDLSTDPCLVGIPQYSGSNCYCKEDPNATISANAIDRLRILCSTYLRTGTEMQNCLKCTMEEGGMYTGMGCVPLNVQEFIGIFVFSWGIGFAGGIALLCIIYSAFRMQTSMGNPEAIKKAQENLTACITGLILIIFSVFILRLIGVSILRIPFLN